MCQPPLLCAFVPAFSVVTCTRTHTHTLRHVYPRRSFIIEHENEELGCIAIKWCAELFRVFGRPVDYPQTHIGVLPLTLRFLGAVNQSELARVLIIGRVCTAIDGFSPSHLRALSEHGVVTATPMLRGHRIHHKQSSRAAWIATRMSLQAISQTQRLITCLASYVRTHPFDKSVMYALFSAFMGRSVVDLSATKNFLAHEFACGSPIEVKKEF